MSKKIRVCMCGRTLGGMTTSLIGKWVVVLLYLDGKFKLEKNKIDVWASASRCEG